MIPFYILDTDGNIVRDGNASNKTIVYAQAKEGDEVIFEALPTDPFELWAMMNKDEV